MLCACAAAAPSSARATVWLVNPDGSGDAPTIQAAVDSAGAFDIIELGDGVFVGPGNRDVNVSESLTFQSQSGNALVCIIDCQGTPEENHRGFSIQVDCEFRNLTISHGQADQGGAIYAAENVAAQIYGCIFSDDLAERGGAIAFDSLDLTAALPEVHIEGSTFLRNQAVECGAIYFLAISIEFTGCRFIENVAEQGGGVSEFVNATVRFADCLFAGNKALVGGVLQCGDPAELEDCTFFGNEAQFGAHIDCSFIDGSTILSRCILANGRGGAAVECSDFSLVGGNVQASCTNIFGNEGGNWVQCLADQLGQNGNLELNPIFCNVDIEDFAISSDSPCAKENSNGCGLIGAYDVGCTPSSREVKSWGHIKSLYR
jgi:hypothetical protein